MAREVGKDSGNACRNLAVRQLCEEWPRLTRRQFHELLTRDSFFVSGSWSNQPRIGPDPAYDAFRSKKKMAHRVEIPAVGASQYWPRVG
jgi:hypothetical protein